jgi:hypothetical protein
MAANEPISDAAVIRLTLPVYKMIGLFGTVTENWRDRPANEWTMLKFKTHVTKGNKEPIQKLTAKAAGYHGANTSEIRSPSTRSVLVFHHQHAQFLSYEPHCRLSRHRHAYFHSNHHAGQRPYRQQHNNLLLLDPRPWQELRSYYLFLMRSIFF